MHLPVKCSHPPFTRKSERKVQCETCVSVYFPSSSTASRPPGSSRWSHWAAGSMVLRTIAGTARRYHHGRRVYGVLRHMTSPSASGFRGALVVAVSTLLGRAHRLYAASGPAPRLFPIKQLSALPAGKRRTAALRADTKSMDVIVPVMSPFSNDCHMAILTILVSPRLWLCLTFPRPETVSKAMRAASRIWARHSPWGISLNKTISFTFAAGSALAGWFRSVPVRLSAGVADHGPCLV